MAEQTSRKGGRSWFGKAEAKAAGRVTRRRDDVVESYKEYLERYFPEETERRRQEALTPEELGREIAAQGSPRRGGDVVIVAGVLDALNNGGNFWIGAFLLVSVAYLLGKYTNEMDRCDHQHPRHGRCRLSRHHRPVRRHSNWKGTQWWS